MKKSEVRKMIREMIVEAGQAAGSLEIAKTSVDKAVEFVKKIGLYDDIQDFEKNYLYTQKLANLGKTQRKNMPVIDDPDIKTFQKRLKLGTLDINKPFAPETSDNNPWPEGLSGWDAQEFVKNGFKDGSKKDDVIGVSIRQVVVGKLKPIQKQIYLSKSAGQTKKSGVETTRKFLTSKTFFVASGDNFIIDGHHRWLSAILIDPNMKVNVLSIDLPINKLLPLANAYGDAIGNKRNQ